MKTKEKQAVDAATEEVKEVEFVPRLIGIENFKMIEQVDRVYSNLLKTTSRLKKAIEASLKRDISIDELIVFFNSNPEKWLHSQYVIDNNIQFPGLSTEKIIEMKLLDISGVQEVIEELNKVQSAIKTVKEVNFFYPVKQLYNEITGEFEITENFCTACEKRFSRYTQNPEQNKILDIFERICTALNELNELNVIRAKNGPDELAMLSDFLEITKVDTNAYFVVNDVLFWRPRLNKYREKTSVLKFKSDDELFSGE